VSLVATLNLGILQLYLRPCALSLTTSPSQSPSPPFPSPSTGEDLGRCEELAEDVQMGDQWASQWRRRTRLSHGRSDSHHHPTIIPPSSNQQQRHKLHRPNKFWPLRHTTRFAPGEVLATLDFVTPLVDICRDWEPFEIKAGRRLVHFCSIQEGHRLIVSCARISPDKYRPSDTIVSCIYREDIGDYFVTSVDIIHLLGWRGVCGDGEESNLMQPGRPPSNNRLKALTRRRKLLPDPSALAEPSSSITIASNLVSTSYTTQTTLVTTPLSSLLLQSAF
jgi:hypothetical protein